MKKIRIFGDSFGENENETNTDLTWFNLLGKKYPEYDIENYCMGGTGCDYSLDIFNNVIESDDISNDIIIFLLTGSDRIQFDFLKKPQHSSSCAFALEKNRLSKFDEYNEIKYIDSFEYDIRMMYNSYSKYLYYDLIKNITYLWFFSKQHPETKFIIFNCFGVDNFYSESSDFIDIVKTDNKKIFELKYDTDNFYFVEKPLFEIFLQQFDDFEDYLNDGDLLNHFKSVSHNKIYEYLVGIIENGEKNENILSFENNDFFYEYMKKVKNDKQYLYSR